MKNNYENDFTENILNLMKEYHKTEIQKVYPNCETMEDVRKENRQVLEKLIAAQEVIKNIKNLTHNYSDQEQQKSYNDVDKIHNLCSNEVNEDLLNSIQRLQDSVLSLQTTIDMELMETNKKIHEVLKGEEQK